MTDDKLTRVRIALPAGATLGQAEEVLKEVISLADSLAEAAGVKERASGYVVRKCDGNCGATTQGHETLPPGWTSSADGRLDYCPDCTKGL